MDEAIRNGLGKETNANSIVKCYVTYVQDLPNGTGKNILIIIVNETTYLFIFFIQKEANSWL